MPTDEQEAIRRLQAGDIRGLEALVHAYHARAVRCAFLVLQDHALALDVTQTAFVKAYEHIAGFDARRPFGPWFLKSVLRDATKAAVRRERTVSLDADSTERGVPGESPDTAPGPDELWEQRELARTVTAALAELPPAERAAIVQRYYLGLSEAEMAAAADRPRGTIKWRLHTARARLRTLLQPLDPDSEML